MLYHFFEYNFIQFPFQLLISEAIFLIGIPKRKKFVPKLALGMIIQLLLGGVVGLDSHEHHYSVLSSLCPVVFGICVFYDNSNSALF